MNKNHINNFNNNIFIHNFKEIKHKILFYILKKNKKTKYKKTILNKKLKYQYIYL